MGRQLGEVPRYMHMLTHTINAYIHAYETHAHKYMHAYPQVRHIGKQLGQALRYMNMLTHTIHAYIHAYETHAHKYVHAYSKSSTIVYRIKLCVIKILLSLHAYSQVRHIGKQLGEALRYMHMPIHTYIHTYTHMHTNTCQVRHIGKQLGEALRYTHMLGMIHGDIKPLNIVRLGERWKLIDLDAACELRSGAKAAAKFSSAYLPPEMVVKVGDGDGAFCVRSEQSRGLDGSELRDPTVSLDRE
jgi:serine/threonine protein kinase